MVATSSSSVFKLAGFSSIAALCLCAAPVFAQSAGGVPGSGGAASGGSPSAGGGGLASSGAPSSGGAPAGGAPSSGGAPGDSGGVSAMSGSPGVGGVSAASGGAPSGAAGMSSNLVTNGTFDTTSTSPWWGYATPDSTMQTLAVNNGQLCVTMTAGGKNPWDIIAGISNLVLLPNQYYHISFSISSDANRTIRFKTGLGDVPYTDYFNEPVHVTTTPQVVDYTYLNLRNDPTAQFQFQVGNTCSSTADASCATTPGTVCLDNIVLEPVPAPAMPTYTTTSHSGHPFKDYKSFIKMGTAVDTPIFLSNPLHNAIVAGEFAMITPANSMKMNLIQPTQGVFDYTDTDALVAWATEKGLEFRGHPLVWHTQTPSWLTATTFTRDQMIDIMNAHIDGLVGHYVGKFPYWDVVNEAVDQVNGTWTFRKTVWHDTIGDDFMDLAFQRAHMDDPNAILLYNDYNIEQKGNAKADYVFNMVSDMKTRGIPINAIGFQGHYFVEPDGTTKSGVPDMQAIADNMARYKAIGIDVQITECDFRIGKPLDDTKTAIQNKFYADLLQVCLDSKNCSHFTVWGLSDLDSWVPSTFPDYDYAHLFDTMLMPKADYYAMTDVFAKYNTDGTLINPPLGMAGAGGNGMLGMAGMAGMAGMGSSSHPSSSAPKQSSGGGCSLAPTSNGTGPWLASVLALLGLALSRRGSKRSRS